MSGHRYRRRWRAWRRRCVCGARVCPQAELVAAAGRVAVDDEVLGVDEEWLSRQW